MLQAEQVLHERYQLKQQLGKNAGRQTWLAEDLGDQGNEPVIVKLLAFSPQLQWDDLKLFEREAQVLKHLDHPKIPRYRDYFSVEPPTGAGLSWFGLVQDYIPGASLQQMLNQGKRFREVQVREIATEVLHILAYLHQLSPPVLHRDIKPSNLILTEQGSVYLVDFGAVQDRAVGEGATFTVVGSCGYAPLEQFWGRAVPASDLYALGATLIHLLTGRPPADLPQENLRICFEDWVSLNPSFVHWIKQLIEPAIEQRFNSATQAMKALQSGVEDREYPLHSAVAYRPPINNSGQGLLTSVTVPEDIIGWNWGAFFLAPLWSISNSVWLGLLAVVGFWAPPIGFLVAIILGAMGNELAWKTRRWRNIEHFKEHQRGWAVASMLIFLGMPGSLLLAIILVSILAS